MKRWSVLITIVEHRREAHVTAPTKAAALAKVRAAEWDSEEGLGDPSMYTIKIVGPCVEDTDGRKSRT